MRKSLQISSLLIILLLVLLVVGTGVNAKAEKLWAVYFTYDLPAGFWDDGAHSYHYVFEWTEPMHKVAMGDPGDFTVSTDASMYQGHVLLRAFYELARAPKGGGEKCVHVDEIHPDQPTRFHIGWVTNSTMASKEAKAHLESMTATVYWDKNQPIELIRQKIKPYSPQDDKNCSWTVRK